MEVGIKEQQFQSEEEEYEKLVEIKSPLAVCWIKGGLLIGVVIFNDDAIMRYKLKFESKSNNNDDENASLSESESKKKRKRDEKKRMTDEMRDEKKRMRRDELSDLMKRRMRDEMKRMRDEMKRKRDEKKMMRDGKKRKRDGKKRKRDEMRDVMRRVRDEMKWKTDDTCQVFRLAMIFGVGFENGEKSKRDNDTCQVFRLATIFGVGFENEMKSKRDNDTCCQVSDVCPICYELWTNYGGHQLCSLPCGHIYGKSCIKKWLEQAESSSRKCPKCNKLCTLEDDVTPLQASRLSNADQKKSSSSSTTTTKYFLFTKKGYEALKNYIWQRTIVAKRLSHLVSIQHSHVDSRAKDAKDRLHFLKKRRDELLKCKVGLEGPQADLFLQRANALDLRILPLTHSADALEQQVYALDLQRQASHRLNGAYEACIDYFEKLCKRLGLDDVLTKD